MTYKIDKIKEVMNRKKPYTNRLVNQKSPYLQQHAHNPVDWYPWDEEAFQAARESNKPIFLSIGYATCHWCHVMEKESFENPHVAQSLNDTFINIKVDREELPEVDSLYMEFAQSMMSGSAGWPLTVILTPELRPFFAATYLPPHSSHGLMGLVELVERIGEVWHSDERERVISQAEKIVEVLTETMHVKGEDLPQKEVIEDTAELLFKLADPIYGGMKGTPKFPIGYQYNFMMHYSSTFKESRALFLVERTLDMIHRGGIYDHLGGGFSRYSVDEKWLVPHFEKMLYDNALLAHTYLEAWQITKKPLYETVCKEILDYVLRDMTHKEGGFYSAEDADSDGHEGLFYTWTPAEVRDILQEEESSLFCEYYDVTDIGNFEGRSILNTKLTIEEFANNKGLDPKELKKQLSSSRKKLWKIREKRNHPFKDDKILSSWNGLMIYSLANAGIALSKPKYLEAALQAAKFIKNNMWERDRLLRRWREGEALYHGSLDEYAYLIRGVLSLFEADCGTEWLEWAVEMAAILENQFKEKDGAFYQTDGHDRNLIIRRCQFSDGAEPSGNAIHCENLLRLYQITGQPSYLDQAEDIFRAVKKYLDNYAPGYCYHIMNINRYYDQDAPTYVFSLNKKQEHKERLLKEVNKSFFPHKSVIWRREGDEKLFEIAPFTKKYEPINGQTTLCVCHEGYCRRPVTDVKEMISLLGNSLG